MRSPISDSRSIDRIVTLVSKQQQPAADLVFWLSRQIAERIAAVEALRMQAMNPQMSPNAEPRRQRRLPSC